MHDNYSKLTFFLLTLFHDFFYFFSLTRHRWLTRETHCTVDGRPIFGFGGHKPLFGIFGIIVSSERHY